MYMYYYTHVLSLYYAKFLQQHHFKKQLLTKNTFIGIMIHHHIINYIHYIAHKCHGLMSNHCNVTCQYVPETTRSVWGNAVTAVTQYSPVLSGECL